MDNINLNEVDFDSDLEEDDYFEEDTELEYPCCIISGVTNKYEVELLKNFECDPVASIPLYINFEDEILLLGKIEISSDYFLRLLAFEGDIKYDLEIFNSPSESFKIDIHNPDDMIKCIRL